MRPKKRIRVEKASTTGESPPPRSPLPDAPRKLNIRFGGCVHEEHKQPIYSVSFYDPLPEVAPDGSGASNPQTLKRDQFFASVGANRATVYKVAGDGALSVAQAYVDEDAQECLYALSWTSSGSNTPLLSVGGFRGLIKVIDCSSGEIRTTLMGHGNAINELRTHPVSPALLLSCSKDESLRLWNIHTSTCIAIFAGDRGHRDEVLSADFHLLGNCLASAGMDNTVKIWALDTPRIQRAIAASYAQPNKGSGVVSADVGVGEGSGTATEAGAKEDAALAQRKRALQTLYEQFPVFSSSKIHSDYVDCVRWVGNLVLSKSTANKVVMWKPDVNRLHNVKSSPETASVADSTSNGTPTAAAAATSEVACSSLSSSSSSACESSGASAAADFGGSESMSGASLAGAVVAGAVAGAVVVLREFDFKDADIWFLRFALDPKLQILAIGNKVIPGEFHCEANLAGRLPLSHLPRQPPQQQQTGR